MDRKTSRFNILEENTNTAECLGYTTFLLEKITQRLCGV
jgi:hypothetical protein